MRLLIIVFLLTVIFSPLSAQASTACKDLDMTDALAIKACLESDTTWYEARTKPIFEPNKECSHLQMQVVKRQIESVDPKKGKRVNSKTLDDQSIPRPSCETVAEVVELIRGRPSAWQPCLGYDEAADKFTHFKGCIVPFLEGRYGSDTNAALSRVSGMDCKRALATYGQALGLIYPPIQEQGPFLGRRLPPSYADPDCDQVNAYVADIKQDVEKARQEQIRIAEAAKAERKRIKEEMAKEAYERKKNMIEAQRKYEEADQKAMDQMMAAGLESRKNREDPKDVIEGKHLHLALVKHIWDQRPEEEKGFGGIKAVLKHTTHGFRTWGNAPMMPNFYHAVKDVSIKDCSVNNGKGHCTYTVTVSSSTEYKDANNQARANFYGQFASAFTGPRTYTWESDFTHDGKQWTVDLTDEQRKLLLPPEIDVSNSRSEQEKIDCDYMSAMGIPMLC